MAYKIDPHVRTSSRWNTGHDPEVRRTKLIDALRDKYAASISK